MDSRRDSRSSSGSSNSEERSRQSDNNKNGFFNYLRSLYKDAATKNNSKANKVDLNEKRMTRSNKNTEHRRTYNPSSERRSRKQNLFKNDLCGFGEMFNKTVISNKDKRGEEKPKEKVTNECDKKTAEKTKKADNNNRNNENVTRKAPPKRVPCYCKSQSKKKNTKRKRKFKESSELSKNSDSTSAAKPPPKRAKPTNIKRKNPKKNDDHMQKFQNMENLQMNESSPGSATSYISNDEVNFVARQPNRPKKVVIKKPKVRVVANHQKHHAKKGHNFPRKCDAKQSSHFDLRDQCHRQKILILNSLLNETDSPPLRALIKKMLQDATKEHRGKQG